MFKFLPLFSISRASLNIFFSPFLMFLTFGTIHLELPSVFINSFLSFPLCSLVFFKGYSIFCFWQLYIIFSFNFNNFFTSLFYHQNNCARCFRHLHTRNTSITNSLMQPDIFLHKMSLSTFKSLDPLTRSFS